jgi:hypothetical protein
MKFARDRRVIYAGVFEAKKRFGLSVLNHMHLLANTPARML